MKICHDWIRVCTAANIPLYKTDNPVLRKFLEDNVGNGGSIPKCSQLRDRYLFDVYEAERTELKSLVRGKKEALSCIFPNCVHVTCLSHIVNLVASDFKKKFKDVTEFV